MYENEKFFFFFVSEHRNSVPPRFNERVSPAPVRTGETAVLSCISQGIPPPTYLWFREKGNGAEVVGNSERVHGRAGVLILQSARTEDAGRYVCHANNTAGSERVELEIFVVSSLSVHLTPQQVSSATIIIIGVQNKNTKNNFFISPKFNDLQKAFFFFFFESR